MMRAFFLMCMFLSVALISNAKHTKDTDVVVAYVTSWTNIVPDPTLMTHINYAFGLVNKTFDGVNIENEERLKTIASLKQQNPKLKVLLSVGGWGAGGFSEMSMDKDKRKAFAKDCSRIVREYNLDGIDIDWEYPTQSSAGIASTPDDTKNFTLLMHDLRKALGKHKLLTCATVASGDFIDFKSCIKYIDLVNVMAYDMGNPPKHHSALYPSDISGWITTSEAVEAHLKKGVPNNKLVMGMPLYGRGDKKYTAWYKDRTKKIDAHEKWSDKSQVPYLANDGGTLVFGYENPRSITIKCQYIHDHNLRGAMYWEYADDNAQGDLRRTIAKCILKK